MSDFTKKWKDDLGTEAPHRVEKSIDKFQKDDKEKYFVYLDKLQQSGKTNMFGARPYLQREFSLSTEESKSLLMEWMHTYDQRHPQKSQVKKAICHRCKGTGDDPTYAEKCIVCGGTGKAPTEKSQTQKETVECPRCDATIDEEDDVCPQCGANMRKSQIQKSKFAKKDEDGIEWITVRGAHIPIKPGQSKTEAVNEKINGGKSGEKKPTNGGESKKPENSNTSGVESRTLDQVEGGKEKLVEEIESSIRQKYSNVTKKWPSKKEVLTDDMIASVANWNHKGPHWVRGQEEEEKAFAEKLRPIMESMYDDVAAKTKGKVEEEDRKWEIESKRGMKEQDEKRNRKEEAHNSRTPIQEEVASYLNDWVNSENGVRASMTQNDPSSKILAELDKPEYRPKKPIKLYRAVTRGQAGGSTHYTSWTSDRKVAQTFDEVENNNGNKSTIISQVFDPKDILLSIDMLPLNIKPDLEGDEEDMSEHEFIIRPTKKPS